jgi:hypothetical protein
MTPARGAQEATAAAAAARWGEAAAQHRRYQNL